MADTARRIPAFRERNWERTHFYLLTPALMADAEAATILPFSKTLKGWHIPAQGKARRSAAQAGRRPGLYPPQ
jgi:hypothetical protein